MGYAQRQTASIARFHHTSWTSDDGLGAVSNIQQSPDGFLWLTTSRGVLRFDGLRFESVQQVTFNAVQDSDILSVFISASGNVWLTTRSAGMLRWKDGVVTAISDRRCTPAGLGGGMIAEENDGSLWFASTTGLTHLQGSSCEVLGPGRGYPGRLPKALFVDRERTVWVVSPSNDLLYKPEGQGTFKPYNATIHSTGTAVAIRQSGTGGIWIADDSGIKRLDTLSQAGSIKVAHNNSPSSRDFTFSADGSLWTVTDDGVSHYSREAVAAASPYLTAAPVETFTVQQGLTSDGVSKLMLDQEGNVWVGTSAGMDSLHRSLLQAVTLPHSQEHEIGLVGGDKDDLWIGSRSMPLTHVAPGGALNGFPEIAKLTCIRRDHNGNIWVGGGGNSSLWRSEGEKFVSVPGPLGDNQPVVALEVDRNNVPWIYTINGLSYRLLNGSWVNVNQELGKKAAVLGSMTSDESGNIWFAFSEKLVEWNGSTFQRYSYPQTLKNISPATMSARNGHVWLAGRGGVDVFFNGQFHQMRWKDRDPIGRVSGVVESYNHGLWINGFSGITHISRAALADWLQNTNSEAVTEHLDASDGLPGFSGDRLPEPSLIEGSDGKIWFATTKGIAFLDPNSMAAQRNKLPPSVKITSILARGKEFPTWKDVVLPIHTTALEADFTALSLSLPQRVLFRYKLENYDKSWQDAGTRRQAFYTGLPPGHYTLHVIACNNDGLWNDTGTFVNLTLLPAFYQTTWFLCLCAVATMVIVWQGYRYRLERMAAAMRTRFGERLDERARVARDLHDTLLQTISVSKLATDQALERPADIAGLKAVLQQLSELLGQAAAEGRAALSALHVSNKASNNLANAIRTAIDESLIDDRMQAELSVDGLVRDIHPIVCDEVYRIAYEGIRNAFTHSEATLLRVNLAYGQDLTLRISDNGRGIDADILHEGKAGHYGLSCIRDRATRIGASLDFKISRPGGTEIILIVPGKAIFLTKGS
ncbi:sensor histidine kinase [Acidisarcina polymorpha]|uniref:sensor histidine kinase n=1 Tax=Acidisarcina polymorpha TaxID=2211140 RepID=UPI000DEEEE9B|nr:sensor histidine kinase [Acidisarcina polymorpha]